MATYQKDIKKNIIIFITVFSSPDEPGLSESPTIRASYLSSIKTGMEIKPMWKHIQDIIRTYAL